MKRLKIGSTCLGLTTMDSHSILTTNPIVILGKSSMDKPKKVLLCFIALMPVMFYGMNTAQAQTAEQIAEKALAATVYLEMKDRNGKILGFGSGFFVREDLIATNFHVIEGASNGTAKLVGKYTTYTIAGITAADETNDLALLKVNAHGIKSLPLGNSDDVKIGMTVYVAGNPLGLEGTFSDGIISSRRHRYTQERLQMTAPISPGSNGGPVLNRKGEVIGVSVSVHPGLDTQNLNFAIPSNYLKKLLDRSGQAKPLLQNNHSISSETYFVWGYTKHELADYNGAIADYTTAIRLKPDYAGIYALRGLAKQQLGQYRAAIADYDKAIQLKPDYVDVYNNRGLSKYHLDQVFDAIADYDKAIQLKPDYAEAYGNRGLAKGALGQHFDAITDCDKAIQLKPDFAEAYLSRGLAKTTLSQHYAAMTDFDKAIQLKPDYAEAYNARAFAKINKGQHFAAITDCDKAIQLKPDFAEAYVTRGFAKGQLGRTYEGMQDLKKALKLAENAGNVKLKSQVEELIRFLE